MADVFPPKRRSKYPWPRMAKTGSCGGGGPAGAAPACGAGGCGKSSASSKSRPNAIRTPSGGRNWWRRRRNEPARRAVGLRHGAAAGVHGGEILERAFCAVAQVKEIGVRKRKILDIALPQVAAGQNQAVGRFIRKRMQQHGVVTLKMAVLVPMPSAMVTIAVMAKRGLLRSVRRAYSRSLVSMAL